ncbi:hypothetical protein L484_013758 [Morus notabilis]|uniref:Uncharacterized protein n=1 Tax=Morus notabilis TaxID=981085 RepID=W9QLN2_9ROSA|nr:hypothetical protein L484_013758 [Morus notabilis]
MKKWVLEDNFSVFWRNLEFFDPELKRLRSSSSSPEKKSSSRVPTLVRWRKGRRRSRMRRGVVTGSEVEAGEDGENENGRGRGRSEKRGGRGRRVVQSVSFEESAVVYAQIHRLYFEFLKYAFELK